MFSGIESKSFKYKSEFLQMIQHIEIHTNRQNEHPNSLAAHSKQFINVHPKAHYFIFTDSSFRNDNKLNGMINSIHMRAATVSLFFHISFVKFNKNGYY